MRKRGARLFDLGQPRGLVDVVVGLALPRKVGVGVVDVVPLADVRLCRSHRCVQPAHRRSCAFD